MLVQVAAAPQWQLVSCDITLDGFYNDPFRIMISHREKKEKKRTMAITVL